MSSLNLQMNNKTKYFRQEKKTSGCAWAALIFGGIMLVVFIGGLIQLCSGSYKVRIPTSNALTERNLPALTEDEVQDAKRLINNLLVNKDDIEEITWYSPNVADGYKTTVYLYIGKKATGETWLRWKIRYYGDDWLFIRKYRIKIDQADATTLLPMAEIKRDTGSSGSVWETFDEPAKEHAHLLNQILASTITYLRMEGTEGVKDIELGSVHLQHMRDVLLVYRYLGGVWSAK